MMQITIHKKHDNEDTYLSPEFSLYLYASFNLTLIQKYSLNFRDNWGELNPLLV